MSENIVSEVRANVLQRMPNWIVPTIRRQLLDALAGIRWGCIEMHDEYGVTVLGTTDSDGPHVRVDVHDPDFWPYAGLGGSTGAGQSYFLKLWDTDDLPGLCRIFVHNRETLDAMDTGFSRIGVPLYNWYHQRRVNSLSGSRQNISAHYDLGNDFFNVMLDETMMYSAAIYPRAGASLEEAQRHKLDVICDKLQLDASHHLLEIGTGWGGLAIHAAMRHGCRVTTTTISREQYEFARARVERAGLSDRVEVIFRDYRELTGQYDRIVSIEMIEAVGAEWFDSYFSQLQALLKNDGLVLLQAITIEDQRFDEYMRSVDFIKRFVFPGGCLPSLSAILDCMKRCTTLTVRHVEDIGDHYARTLMDWQQRIDARAGELHARGYDDSFLRMWRYYLAYCFGGFAERSIADLQILFEKPDSRNFAPVSGARAEELY